MEAVHAPETGQACTLSAPAELPPVEVYAAEAEALDDPFNVDEQGRILYPDYADARDQLNEIFGAETFDPESEAPDETERIEAREAGTDPPDTAARWIVWAMRADMPGSTAKRRETERLVLLCLCAAIDWKPSAPRYGQCFPAVRRIAKDTGLSAGTVKSALDALRAAELIRWTSPPPDARGRGRNSLYTLAPAFEIAGQADLFGKLSTSETACSVFQGVELNRPCSENEGVELNRPVQFSTRGTERTPSKPHKKIPHPGGGREKLDSLPGPERPEIDGKAARADQREAVAAQDSADWIRSKRIKARDVYEIAQADTAHFEAVREHVDGAGGQCGPGLIVQMLRGEADIPDAPAYTPPRMCRACASTYCRNVDPTAPPCAANAP